MLRLSFLEVDAIVCDDLFVNPEDVPPFILHQLMQVGYFLAIILAKDKDVLMRSIFVELICKYLFDLILNLCELILVS